ncbi:MAG: hypothetical protein GWP03_06105 [Proteobacteria bacterium]|nr:hypothetical protein [Pseudomonadota bacterium]
MYEKKNKQRIGVYVCHCGGNISEVVDVKNVRDGTGKHNKWVQKAGELTLKHLEKYVSILKCEKIETMRKAHILFSDYRKEKVLERKIDLMY